MKKLSKNLFLILLALYLAGCGTQNDSDPKPSTLDENSTNTDLIDEGQIDETSNTEINELPSSITFVDINGGSFTMGGTTIANDSPIVTVILSSYKISDKEITNEEYLDFLNSALQDGLISVKKEQERRDPCGTYTADLVSGTQSSLYDDKVFIELTNYGGCTSSGEEEDIQNRTYIEYSETSEQFYLVDDTKAQWPANWITWYGASSFAKYYGVSLPTEAQWEYAAKIDQNLEYATADGIISSSQSNYNGDLPGVYNPNGHVMKTGSYAPNPFGLYDMSGNVWEWCEDHYSEAFYESGSVDPVNEIDNDEEKRVRRGGSWNYHSSTLLTYARASDIPSRGNNHFGFRVVINPTLEMVLYNAD